MLIWILDVGTSGLHGLLMDEHAQTQFLHYIEYAPTYGEGGMVEQNPQDWREAAVAASRACVSAGYMPDAVALTSQRSSLILLDGQGNPMAPAVMWQDTRSRTQLSAMEPQWDTIYRKSGAWPNPVFAGPKIAWMHDAHPDLWRQADHLAVIPDYLMQEITGRCVTDVTCAARTHMMDLLTRRWDEELAALFHAPMEKLSPIVPQGSIAGTVSAVFAEETGLPAGIPVITSGGDQQCAALGAGVWREGQALINVGTGANILLAVEQPCWSDRHAFLTIPSAVPERYLLETSSLTAASVYRWFRRQFYTDDGYGAINREAEAAGPGAHGLLLLPHLQGRGAPDWNRDATGVFHGVTLGTTRGDFARAILEGIALELLFCLESLPIAPAALTLKLTGGLTACPAFPQMMADVTGCLVQTGMQDNYTALGAWANAMKALNPALGYDDILHRCALFSAPILPDPARHALYRELRNRAQDLYRRLY